MAEINQLDTEPTIKTLLERMDDLRQLVEMFRQEMTVFRQSVEARFDKIESRLAAIEDRVETLEIRQDKHDSVVYGMRSDFKEWRMQLKEMVPGLK